MMKLVCPSYIAKRKDSLAFKLFSYMTAIVISILLVQALAEQALVKAMLKVPNSVKMEMLDLAHQANVLIEHGDMDELADWANAQQFYLFVLNEQLQPVTHRLMHPHFEFKLQFKRSIDDQLEDKVNRPIISIPLVQQHNLVIQLPHRLHPANDFILYFSIIKVVIAAVILALFSLLMARNLQQPLDRLREASKKLSNGDFNVSVVQELKSNTREFNELAQDFDHMTKEIHSLAEKQRLLIRDVSHELRTPLARQNLVLHLLRKRVGESEQELVTRLEDEAKELNHLISDILEFSRLENARYDKETKRSDLEVLLAPQVERCKIDLRESQSIVFISRVTEPRAYCEDTLVVRCLNNLVGNAIKYAGEDARIEVTLTNQEINGQAYLVMSVSDDGPGIPENKLSDIFNPFTRLDASRDKKLGGYGLGLAIVKESMRMMGGAVNAENRSQGGLTVSLVFRQ
ncbi:HAMP domain-containing protein [Vibrio parahaemolyticus]|nr:HAMP domain-containing protein [Vibrio parahaemolyticus]EGQ8699440.1 HAMP domain-containing protein [Vibrio parahaemolyticus]EGQ8754335.1 HAMP domain-containing protein [Vibrio parahaemolyticus]EGQ8758365.1 HAMP domain-containing protein [Vibrio parahaemolyticus]EGQ8773065.1 HAMP domain-containing protein [Vibrio parahaemolyticus]